ncbi:MAG: hypothetical protein GX682_01620 [Clostridiaceae bacterium]|nr:hypothetical protein [Clostridiaceae bacterium]
MKSNEAITIKQSRFIKLVTYLIILTIVFYAFFNVLNKNIVFGAQVRQGYSTEINKYPGYKELIDKLKKDHPNWKFTIFYTGLDWSQVIKNETTACHGRNVVPSSRSNAWKCSVCGETPRGGSSWRCASEAAVSYYMDPRNWLNDTYIFEFENLSYNEEIQNVEGVKKIISSIKYMQGDKVTYTKTDGTKATLDKSYAQIIMEAAKQAGISPYHLASRIRQEQGAGTTPGSTATGTYTGYVGYYNFLNIKASGSTDREVIVNGLQHAKNSSWTDPEISIIQGSKVLAKNYINDGQDTLYLQKFDVDNSDGTLYYFQYMQNVSASVSEGAEVKNAYNQLGLLNSSIEFIIPVYENMPQTACQEPIDASIVTQNVKVKGTGVSVRAGTGTTTSKVATVNTGDTLLRIEIAATMNSGYYWDKVILPNGTVGYIARTYLVETTDVKNCEETVIANTTVNLRNGPGLNETTIITTLVKGQALTRIQKGQYTLNAYVWDRVKLADGRQGYIVQDYISLAGETTTETDEKTQLIKVICNSGLKIREEAGIDKKILTYVSKNEILTRTQASVSSVNGYTWDKVVTATGIEGYIARGTATEQYVEEIKNDTEPNKGTDVVVPANSDFKVQDTKLICEPATTVEVIEQKNSGKTVVVKDSKGTVVKTGNIGTGYTITINSKTYTASKLGDVNGDGNINSGDLFYTQKYLLKKIEFNDCTKKACDVNGDNNINSGDLFYIQKYLLKKTEFHI